MSSKIILAVVGTAATIVTAIGTYLIEKKKRKTNSLGSFAIWGRPNSGKTTFIKRLLGVNLHSDQKEATTHSETHQKIKLPTFKGRTFTIEEVTDMPGTDDRKKDWLQKVDEKDHVFYMVNLAKLDNTEYTSAVRSDVKATLDALKKSNKESKRIHLIFSHLDESKWRNHDLTEVNNILQKDAAIRLLYESMGDFSGYVYSVNFLDEGSYQHLRQDIINDFKS